MCFRRHALIATVRGFHGSEPDKGARREIINSSRQAEGHTIRFATFLVLVCLLFVLSLSVCSRMCSCLPGLPVNDLYHSIASQTGIDHVRHDLLCSDVLCYVTMYDDDAVSNADANNDSYDNDNAMSIATTMMISVFTFACIGMHMLMCICTYVYAYHYCDYYY